MTKREKVEIVIITHTNRLVFNLEGIRARNAFYWRDGGQGQEVDIVVTLFSKPLAIEVKYQSYIGKLDPEGSKKFNKKHKNNTSLVITKDKLELKKPIILVPAWIYLLIC
jgi:predicted AAA+ superfamily ATPase